MNAGLAIAIISIVAIVAMVLGFLVYDLRPGGLLRRKKTVGTLIVIALKSGERIVIHDKFLANPDQVKTTFDELKRKLRIQYSQVEYWTTDGSHRVAVWAEDIAGIEVCN